MFSYENTFRELRVYQARAVYVRKSTRTRKQARMLLSCLSCVVLTSSNFNINEVLLVEIVSAIKTYLLYLRFVTFTPHFAYKKNGEFYHSPTSPIWRISYSMLGKMFYSPTQTKTHLARLDHFHSIAKYIFFIHQGINKKFSFISELSKVSKISEAK